MKKLHPRTRRAIVEASKRGEKHVTIARRFGIAPTSVTRIVREAGLPPKNVPLDAQTAEFIRRRYAAGVCIADIRRELGLGSSTVRRALGLSH